MVVPASPRRAERVRCLARSPRGFFRFGPANTYVPDQRRYLPGTLVLETTWHTPTGWLTVQDLLVVGRTDDARRGGYRRPPGDEAALGYAAAPRHVFERTRRGGDELPAAVRVRDRGRGVELRRGRLPARGGTKWRTRTGAFEQHAARIRRRAQLRAHDARRGIVGVRRTVVGRARSRRATATRSTTCATRSSTGATG